MPIDYQHFRTDKWGAAGILLRFLLYMVFAAAPIPAAFQIGLSLSWNTGLPVFAIAWRQIKFIIRWIGIIALKDMLEFLALKIDLDE